ncbi:hypothetical protein LCGC14_2636170, partial [marine sediment metagenome]
ALRARVAKLEDKLVVERAMVTMHKAAEDRAVYFSEAAKAREVELAGALEWVNIHADSLAADLRSAHHSRGEGGSQWMADDDRELRANFRKAIECTRTVLAGTLAEALERARAVGAVLKAARFFMEDGIAEDSPDLNRVAWQALDEALTMLDALGKKEKEDAPKTL